MLVAKAFGARFEGLVRVFLIIVNGSPAHSKATPLSRRIISVDAEGKVQSVEAAGLSETRERLAELAWLLDSSIRVPGTRLTVGLEALVGLLPFIGDLIGVLFSTYIVSEAARLGAPKSVLTRMAFNVGLEGVVGILPLAGDAFDALFKANQRNVKLLDDWLEQPKKAERSSRAFAIVLMLAGLGVLLARWIWSSL
jgi:hypothetical protein